MDLKPPHCETWKSEFARRFASKKISEEFRYFAQIYDRLKREHFQGDLKADQAVLDALDRASRGRPLINKEEEVPLPEGSKVCIVGAGMSGRCKVSVVDYHVLTGNEAFTSP